MGCLVLGSTSGVTAFMRLIRVRATRQSLSYTLASEPHLSVYDSERMFGEESLA